MGIFKNVWNKLLRKIVDKLTRNTNLVVVNVDDYDEVTSLMETFNNRDVMSIWDNRARVNIIRNEVFIKTMTKRTFRKAHY